MVELLAPLIRKFSFFKTLGIFFLGILCGLTTLAILYYRNTQAFNNTATLVTHTREIIDETSIISSLSKDLQWEARNYILTGNTKSLEQYNKIADSLHTSAASLTTLVSDNSPQKLLSQTLQQQIDSLIDFTQKSVKVDYREKFSLNEFLVNVDRHIQFRGEIDNRIQLLRSEENRLLVIRMAAVFKSIENNDKILSSFFILIFLLLAGAFSIITYHTRKRINAEKELAERESRFRVLINSIKDLAIFMTDVNGNILTWYQGASNLKGYKNEEVIGKNISIFYTKESQNNNEPFDNLQSAIQSGSFETEGWRVRKDGSSFWADVLITAVYDADGILQGFTKVTRDFTLHKKAEDEMKRMFRKEKELNEMKSNFVSMASHEFRTPLTSILSSVSLLEYYKTTETQEKRDKHIQRIKSAIADMVSLLEEFLSIEKIEEGRIEVKRERFNLKALVDNVCLKLQNSLKPGQQIKCTNEGLEDVVLDIGFAERILTNVISNAIKYSLPDSSIYISTLIDQEKMQMKVKDEGIGISTEDQQYLFQRFFRASNTGNIRGTGLGLHIVKRYVDLMNGTISVKSEIGKGSEFCITIPSVNGETISSL